MMSETSFFQRSALGRVLWTFRREFMWVGVFSLFCNLLMLTPTVYMLQLFDRVMSSGSELTLLALTGITVFFFGVMGFAEWVRSRLLVRAGARFDEALHNRVFNATFEANLDQASKRPMQAFADLTNLRQFLTGNAVFAMFDAPWTPVYIAVLFLMHPWLGWAAIGFSALMILIAYVGHRLTAAHFVRAQKSAMETSGYVHGKLRNAETVEALGMVGNLRRQWLTLHETQLSDEARAHHVAARVQALTKFVQYTQQSLILSLGALLAIDGKIGVGAMVASNALIGNALRPIGTLVAAWKQYIEARQAYGRLETLLEDYPERAAGHSSSTVQGQISLRQLSATAPGRPTPILDGLDAEFKAGEVVAIVGPSGAGKSTLARCLVGVWPNVQGEVLLDGHPVTQWSREMLGPQVGYLPQDIELFDGTIAENIARFGPAGPALVIEAASRTGIHDMILRLPKGYDTPMGEAGALLSGGQRQRIGLARAILGNPKLVVLDEPNANLDDLGETALVRTVRDLRGRGAAVFMIVHQQHLLAAADRVLVLEAGRITRLVPVVATPAPQQIQKTS